MVKPSIKILHIITRLDLGGSAENTLLTAIGFAQRGYRVDILAGNSDNPPSDNEKKALEKDLLDWDNTLKDSRIL